MCSRAEPRLHHSSNGGGGGGGGNNNSQAAATAAAASAADPSAAERSPPPSRPRARPAPQPPPPPTARGGGVKECLCPGAPSAPALPSAARLSHPGLPGRRRRFIYLFPVREDVGAPVAGWLRGAFSVEADRRRQRGGRGAGADSAEGSDAHGAAAPALFSGAGWGLRWKLVSV